MKPSTVLTVAALSGIPVLTALGLALTLHHHPHEVAFSDQGVNVVMRLSQDGDRLLTTFTPQRPGFHLSSVGLPAGGIEGFGRPTATRIEVGGALRSRGPLVAQAPVRMLPVRGTHLAVPAYPDGPVTTELPVAVDEHGDARVVVSYAACSSQVCLLPVTGHPVEIPAAALADMR
ncbi:MAG: hypothetical protein HOV87_27845 [Catenulispora sp.]|nr:hypothetical protein [Catenulispora sp.]